MDDEKRTTCEIEDGKVLPCWGMDSILELESHRKGVVLLKIIDVNKGCVDRTLVAVRSGDHAKRGVCINYCPMCGASFYEHVHGGKAEEAGNE
ncbi:hypothetical protein KS4_23710 [Poriferisphaera corsica]|uniref:Uncharacterized protein n=1 Tax=Poriferisphaera corsica TaxID=2528020 RepID=A0A517YVQ0_9BACT|nr:hypothetical protein [Poriferisphaera corsica]QDU34304.1 hypothetical protein KS4_23710 [Poriferisphaera corsica]